jgi:glycosyltransferase involved in cell wall biosynthesis
MKDYAVVTPARDERGNLERVAEALIAQELRPIAWVIVDDGSVDGTDRLAEELARTYPWITVARTGRPSANLPRGRREGRELLTLRHGIRAIPERVDVVVKVDADTSFASTYFDHLMTRFAADPTLGIASGTCHELVAGAWVRRRAMPTQPRGAMRAYRWECLDIVMDLPARMGWDTLDAIKAQLRGYESRIVPDLPYRHHRRVGARERNRHSAQAIQGRAAWYLGYRPSYLALRVIYRARRDPFAIAMAWGYAEAALRGAARHHEHEVVARLRETQRLREVVRSGRPV